MNDEISAIGQYQSKHSTCDIQLHPWQAVFGAGFEAGNSAAAARAEAAAQATIAQRDARIAELMAALTEAAWLMSNTPTDRPFSQEDVDADNEWYERADLWSERFDALMARTPAAPSAVAQEPRGEGV